MGNTHVVVVGGGGKLSLDGPAPKGDDDESQ